jgi:hypothetical protein
MKLPVWIAEILSQPWWQGAAAVVTIAATAIGLIWRFRFRIFRTFQSHQTFVAQKFGDISQRAFRSLGLVTRHDLLKLQRGNKERSTAELNPFAKTIYRAALRFDLHKDIFAHFRPRATDRCRG